jgi:hypothetical protein
MAHSAGNKQSKQPAKQRTSAAIRIEIVSIGLTSRNGKNRTLSHQWLVRNLQNTTLSRRLADKFLMPL